MPPQGIRQNNYNGTKPNRRNEGYQNNNMSIQEIINSYQLKAQLNNDKKVKEAVKKVIKECIKNEYIIKVYYNTTVAKSNIVKLDLNQNL
jgi:hypothetical protein